MCVYSDKLARDTLRKLREIQKDTAKGVANQKTVDDLKKLSMTICAEVKALRK